MTAVIEILNQLRTRDIKIWVKNDRLCINAPKGALDSALKSELSARKPEIIAYLNAANTTQTKDIPALVPFSHSTPPPLSFTQYRLWFLDQLEPGSITYNIPIAMRLTGSLDVTALEKSLQMVVERHEVLRTTFSQVDGRPVQQIHPDLDFQLKQVDLSNLSAAQQIEAAAKHIELDVSQPFDLSHGPLLRSKLFRLGDTDHILLFTQHHIITDRWSMGLMWQEMTTLYNDIVAGKPSSLTPLPIQYGDYAFWQQKWLETEAFQAQLDYWLEQLNGTLPVLELPLDHPRSVTPTHRGGKLHRMLPADLVHGLQQLGQAQGATLFMTVLAAFKALLFRYTGQEDLLIGTSIANRNRVETSSLIGFFVNTLLLRTDLSGQPSFQDLLGRVKQMAMEAFTNQEMPVEKLIELLQPKRDNGRATLFDVLFIFQNTPEVEGSFANVTVSKFPLEFEQAMFDLTWYVVEQADGLAFTIEYNADLFEAATMERLFSVFEQLMRGIVAAPTAPITQLPLLPLQEQRVLDEWRQTRSLPLPTGCVHHWFEAQARTVPGKTAVSHQTQQLSYAELNVRANQLAHYLIENGVKPDTIVGLHLLRSTEMIVALLGILKAGGAYLPLDPSYPVNRLQFMVDDARPILILTVDELPLTIDDNVTQIVQMSGAGQFADYPEHNPETPVSHEHLAYIIYTSGSTGTPKGVQIEHRAMANFVQGAAADYPISGEDRVLQFATIAFDTAVEEIYPCLTQGGTLVLRTDTMIDTMDTFLTKCAEWGITVLDLPTAFWHHLTISLATENLSLPQCVKLVIIGGEKANEQALKQWQQSVGTDVRLLNTYGPTETTVVATMYEASSKTSLETVSKGVLIGRPLPNYEVYVLDAAMQPVPIGVAGELLVGGPGLARGYLNRPELTDEKFLPNPFGAGRLYRTGDLVGFLPDGNLEFMGRTDDQVKIRGYRIELGEIEAALTQHPHVQQAVVIAYEPNDSDRQLAAYLITDEAIGLDALHLHLQNLLPAYMVPASFTMLDMLPLMPNGKVDRRALPEPDRDAAQAAHTYVAPRSPAESELAEIWAEVLKVEQVGIHDDFFMLGGHSLLATRIVSRIRQAFPVELPLRVLFDKPTIAELAEVIANEQASTQTNLPIEPVDRNGKLQLSFAQKRFWILEQMEQVKGTYNIPQAVRLHGQLNVPVLEDSLTLLVERHEILRTTYTEEDGMLYQIIHEAKPIHLPQVDLSQSPDSQRKAERLIREEASAPFDLSQDWPIRMKLIYLGVDDYILLTTMHHIASDGWSFTVFGREMALIYESLEKGKTPLLPPLPVQYADFAVWQEKMLQESEETAAHLTYWKDHLSGNPAHLEMPIDYKRPTMRTYHGGRVERWLSDELSRSLYEFGQEESASLFMVLLAAFKLILHRYSGQDDILIGSPFAGRTRPELENMIGLFLNTVVLRTDLSGKPTYRELIRRVREVCLSAFAHQEIPFEMILEELRVERDPSRTPLFQVFFNVLNFGSEAHEFGSLTFEPIINPELDSKFDLTLYVGEKQGSVGLFLVYNTDLFTEARMSEFIEQFTSLLQQVIATPDQLVSHYSLVTDSAKAVLPNPLIPLDNTWHGPVHEALERHAEHRPQHTAVIDKNDTWTYAELNKRSNQLAHFLIEQGVQPQEVVAIYGHRSASIVWALMGVFKAGAAFLILDPAYPSARLVNYLQLAQPKAFVNVTAAGAPPPQILDAITEINCEISLSIPSLAEAEEMAFLAAYPTTNPDVAVGRDDMACLAFTSGSTGIPKGIQGRHGSLTHFLPWIAEEFGLDHTDRFSMLSGLAHDPLQRDIFSALWVGGVLCIPDPQLLVTPGWVANWLRDQRVTFSNLTPAMSQLITTGNMDGETAVQPIPSLRYAFFIGEVLTRQEVSGLRQLCPYVTAVNLYGTTETQRALSYCVIPTNQMTDRPVPKDVIPLGKGMIGSQLLLLNQTGELAGIGEMAEICFRSPHLALGYLNDIHQTKRSFRLNPFGATDEHDRLYLTGDMGRYLPNGDVVFANRSDAQVNIRGFRVELGEIEGTLIRHPSVQQATVIAQEASLGNRYLVAYIVASTNNGHSNGNTSLPSGLLRDYLNAQLPTYMIPAKFMFIDRMPLTPNGKVDWRALPIPDSSDLEIENHLVKPRNATEAALVKIWEDVLGIHPISIHDNFFEIGGHSLLALQILIQIRDRFDVELNLFTLFQYSTPAQLSKVILAMTPSESITESPETSPENIFKSLVHLNEGEKTNSPPLFIIHGGGGDILFLQEWKKYLSSYNLYGFQARGIDGITKPHTSQEEMAADYIEEMKTVYAEGPYFLIGYSGGGSVAIEMAQQLQEQGDNVSLVILIDTYHPSIKPRHLKSEEHYQKAIKSPVKFFLNKLTKNKERFQYVINARKIAKLVKNGQRIPLELRELYMLRNFYGMRQRHNTKHYHGPIVLFSAKTPWHIYDHVDKYRGWQDTLTNLIVHEIPGNHADMIREPNVQKLLTELKKVVEAVGEDNKVDVSENPQKTEAHR